MVWGKECGFGRWRLRECENPQCEIHSCVWKLGQVCPAGVSQKLGSALQEYLRAVMLTLMMVCLHCDGQLRSPTSFIREGSWDLVMDFSQSGARRCFPNRWLLAAGILRFPSTRQPRARHGPMEHKASNVVCLPQTLQSTSSFALFAAKEDSMKEKILLISTAPWRSLATVGKDCRGSKTLCMPSFPSPQLK